MPNEIERRFLLKDPTWRPTGKPVRMVQGYFWMDKGASAHIEQRPSKAFYFVLQPKDSNLIYSLPLPAKDGAELKKIFNPGWVIRVRQNNGKNGVLTLKGKSTNKGRTRPEYEYALTRDDTNVLLSLTTGSHVVKDRYRKPHKGYVWEVDVYHGAHKGHVVCEVEVEHANEEPPQPAFVGMEVTHLNAFGAGALARTQRIPAYPKAR